MRLENDTHRTYKDTFYVLEEAPVDIILGLPFLTTNEAVLNMKTNTLELDGRTYEFSGDQKTPFLHSLEESTCEKTRVYMCTDAVAKVH